MLGRAVLESLFADSPVPPSPSDCSLGIWTLSRGRLASDWFVFDLVGARILGTLEVLVVRCGGCGDLWVALRWRAW